MRNFLFRRKRLVTGPVLPQGFDVRVTLRKGDKVVRRNRRGDVEIVRVTTEIAQLDPNGDDRRR